MVNKISSYTIQHQKEIGIISFHRIVIPDMFSSPGTSTHIISQYTLSIAYNLLTVLF